MKANKLTAFCGLLLLLSPSLASCGGAGESGGINLRVLNWEDYIGEYELEADFDNDGEFETYPDVISAFEAYEWIVNGKKVNVIYDTFDTNETMLSSLKTGKSTYDLICPSDYTIQKMMSQGMLVPFEEGSTPNYDASASPYLSGQLDYITADDGTGEQIPISRYSRGYMWGTLGVLYNPAKVSEETGVEEDAVKFDMADWNSLWDSKYHGQMSIKDSMRDTYSVGIMKLFDAEVRKAILDSGYYDENLLAGIKEQRLRLRGRLGERRHRQRADRHEPRLERRRRLFDGPGRERGR